MSRTLPHDRRLAWAFAVSLLLVVTGCRGPWSEDWTVSDMWDIDYSPWSDDAPKKGIPLRLVDTWADTVMHQSGQNPQRGFGGRIIFYGKKSEEPILVEGQLVVYAFDETNRLPTDHKPTRRYVFPPDQVARRMSVTELGPSYSFWLPWDEAGGPKTEVSLIARFQPTKGSIVVGEQTKHLLPGEINPQELAAAAKPSAPRLPEGIPMRPATPTLSAATAAVSDGVQQASYSAPVEPVRDRMTTTSISLPESFRLRETATSSSARVVAPQAVVPAPQTMPTRSPITVPRQTQHAPQPFLARQAAFTMPSQSPLGSGFVAPAGQVLPNSNYQPAGAAAAWTANPAPTPAPQPPSSGFPQQPLQAPTTPVAQ